MKQKYPEDEVLSPGTVIISAAAQCSDIKNIVTPVAKINGGDLYYIDFSKDDFHLGGSSFGQTQNKIGNKTPSVQDPQYFKKAFNVVQDHIKNGLIVQVMILDLEVLLLHY